MTCLVTGASGFLGGHIAERLCQRGEEVRILARKTSDLSAIEHLPIEIFYGDLSKIDSIISAAAGVDTVFHCAGAVKHAAPYRQLYDTNVIGTKNVAIASGKAGVKRIVYASSLGVYGPDGHITYDVAGIIKPSIKENYCRSKAEAEILFFEKCSEMDIEGVALRPGVIYGPRDYTASYHWFRAVDENRVALIGNGAARLPLIYIEDLVDAFISASEQSGISGNAYNLDGPDEASLKRIYDFIAKELGKNPVYHYYSYSISMLVAKFNQLRTAMTGNNGNSLISPFVVELFGKDHPKPDCQKAREDLGFLPKTGIGEGIRKTAEWYRKIEMDRRNSTPTNHRSP